MIRIITGRLRGKRIRAPRNLPVRPTTDRAKESLFNILNNHFYFEEISALDLFSGTGNITYELASRGCTDITVVEQNPAGAKFIEKTATELKLEGVRVIRGETLKYLSRDFRNYDFIFADPPYEYEEYEKLVELVRQNNLLKEDGLLVIEHQSRKSLEDLAGFSEVRKYGHSSFSFFGSESNNPGKED